MIHFVSAIFISTIHLLGNYAVGGFVIKLFGYPFVPFDPLDVVNNIHRLSWRIPIYLVIAIVCHSFAFYQRLREEELKTSRLESELVLARLNALKIRLSPEVIFNAFSGIMSAMEKDLKKATQLIVSLGDYLRLRLNDKQIVMRTSEGTLEEPVPDSTSVESNEDLLASDEPIPELNWKWLSVAWIFIGIFFTARVAMTRELQGSSSSWVSIIFMNIPWILWAFATPRLLRFYDRFPLESKHFLKNFGVHTLVGASFWIITIILGFLAQSVINRAAGKESNDLLLDMITTGFTKNLLAYWIFVFFVRANRYYYRYVQRKLRLTELAFQLTSAQLQALKMQLHPHFLFNALHSLMGLIYEDRIAAQKMLDQLQRFFHMTLQEMAAQKVPLEKELEFLNCYLDIEKVRFQDRLQVRFDVDAAAMTLEVPNLLLQPLVENAVKHGISKRPENGGEINKHAGFTEKSLRLIVRDNGTGIEKKETAPIQEGVGLANIRERLQKLYGDSHRLMVDALSGGGFRVVIEIPIKTMSPVGRGQTVHLPDRFTREAAYS